METRVIVVGGGYGGIAAAKALDEVADVTLVEPREAFLHNVATLRAAVDPAWADRIFIPYDKLLSRGRVVRDAAVEVRPDEVLLSSGERLAPDYLVLATGSTGPFPSRIDTTAQASVVERLRAAHAALDRASGVLLLGGGAVGLEFAGEIAAAWPGRPVTVVDPSPDLLGGRFPDALRADLARQLAELGVRVLLGTRLDAPPETPAGAVRPFTVRTGAGETLAADLWFPCYGSTVTTTYLTPELATARRPDGRLAVTQHLRVHGHERVFAVGDLNDTPELKMGRAAGAQGEVAAANIRALIEGGPLTAYEPFPDGILLTLGPAGGVGYVPEFGLLDAAATAQFKATFRLEQYRELLGAV